MYCCKSLMDHALVDHYRQFHTHQIEEVPPETLTIKTIDMEGYPWDIIDFTKEWGLKCTLIRCDKYSAEYKIEDV